MPAYSELHKSMYKKAVAESGCTQFIAETKILFPSIEKILMRAVEVISDKLPSLSGEGDTLFAYLLLRIRKIYSAKCQEWHSQKIVIAEFFSAIAKIIEQVVSLAFTYEIQLKNGLVWSFRSNGPLLAVYNDIACVIPPKSVSAQQESSPELHAFLFTLADRRMMQSSVATRLGVAAND